MLFRSVDTATGGIGKIALDGQTYSFSTTAFTPAVTDIAGWYVNSWSGDTYGFMDNVLLTEIPEPATVALLLAAGALLPRRRR